MVHIQVQVVCESMPPENTDLPHPLDWGAFGIKLLGVLIGNWLLNPLLGPGKLRLQPDLAGSEEYFKLFLRTLFNRAYLRKRVVIVQRYLFWVPIKILCTT